MKKGQTDMFMDVMSYVLFTVIVIVFFLIFHLIKGCNNPAVERVTTDSDMKRNVDMLLVNILRSPVEEGRMTDLIWLYYQDDSYEDELEAQLTKAMGRVVSDYPCWEIELIDEDVVFSVGNNCMSEGEKRQAQVMIALPMNEKRLTLDVRLTQYKMGESIYGMS